MSSAPEWNYLIPSVNFLHFPGYKNQALPLADGTLEDALLCLYTQES
jgi:hypothetical protein